MSSDPLALEDAVLARDAAGVLLALAEGADPCACDADDAPLLLVAAESGDLASVRALLDAGAPVGLANRLGHTALTCAVMARSLPLVELLLARGADPSLRLLVDVAHGDTPLTIALDRPEPVALVTTLLAAGADPNGPRHDGWTPLMLAAQAGDLVVTEVLLAHGADPAATKGELTAAYIALHWGQASVVERLRDAGAPDPERASAARVAEHWRVVDAWFSDHAVPCHEALAALRGASEPELAALEVTVGERLPADLRAHLARYGSATGAPFYEYAGLGVSAVAATWGRLGRLRAKGTFDGWEPHGLAADELRVARDWWSPGWIPFARDGGGNLWCVDLAPGPGGARGQVIAWEIHGGPSAPVARSFQEFLRRFRDALVGGGLAYDAASGIFDPVTHSGSG